MSAFPYHPNASFFFDSCVSHNMAGFWDGLPPLNCSVPPFEMVDQCSKSVATSENLDLKVYGVAESSTVVDKVETGEHDVATKRGKNSGRSTVNSGKERKGKRQKKETDMEDRKEERKTKKIQEEPPTGYIHVRARRGQATDSHSLAERVRREKISERMKALQRLVPGCDKVSGKALVLDEIINYVQSLQNQVEFLSMKLASANPLFYEFGFDIDDLQCLTTLDSSVTPMTTSTAMEASSTVHLLEGQMPIDVTQISSSAICESERQRQKLLNPSWFDSSFVFSPMK